MINIILINRFIKEHPAKFWIIVGLTIIGLIIAKITLNYARLNYTECHTPKLEITEKFFCSEPVRSNNDQKMGIRIIVANQSNAWAKNVMIDFINDDGFNKYEKIKYFRKNNLILEPKEIEPTGKILDGYLPLGISKNPAIYKNNEKKYKVDIFINWGNDKGERYSLVAGYESIADGFNKQIRFKSLYRYDSFTNKKKVAEIKNKNKDYLPDDMI